VVLRFRVCSKKLDDCWLMQYASLVIWVGADAFGVLSSIHLGS
jgi:hypothetical protein